MTKVTRARMVSCMGKQPDCKRQFCWARIRPGYYSVTVDSVDYTVIRTGKHRWNLTGTIGPDRHPVMDTRGESASECFAYARRAHAANLDRKSVV